MAMAYDLLKNWVGGFFIQLVYGELSPDLRIKIYVNEILYNKTP